MGRAGLACLLALWLFACLLAVFESRLLLLPPQVVRSSLKELRLAVKGMVVMSSELEKVGWGWGGGGGAVKGMVFMTSKLEKSVCGGVRAGAWLGEGNLTLAHTGVWLLSPHSTAVHGIPQGPLRIFRYPHCVLRYGAAALHPHSHLLPHTQLFTPLWPGSITPRPPSLPPSPPQLSTALLSGRVPELWLSRSFPSLKPLGPYVKEVLERCEFFQGWLDSGLPVLFWISGFFFTQVRGGGGGGSGGAKGGRVVRQPGKQKKINP